MILKKEIFKLKTLKFQIGLKFDKEKIILKSVIFRIDYIHDHVYTDHQ